MAESQYLEEQQKRAVLLVQLLCRAKSVDLERLGIELKSFGPLGDEAYVAKISKAVMALANYGGGMVILGFAPTEQGYEEQTIDETELKKWSAHVLHQKLEQYMAPLPEVGVFVAQGEKSRHPVFIVPSHGRVPITCMKDSSGDETHRGDVYTRRPGPRSEVVKNADEWAAIIRRCTLADANQILVEVSRIIRGGGASSAEPLASGEEASLLALVKSADDRFDSLLEKERPGFLPERFGRCVVAYQILPKAQLDSLGEVKTALAKAAVMERGRPIGAVLPDRPYSPRPYEHALEAWIPAEAVPFPPIPPSLDYWMATCEGFFYATRIYPEDIRRVGQANAIEVTLPVLTVKEATVHALRYARMVNGQAKGVLLYTRYVDLGGRVLFSGAPWPRYGLGGKAPRCDSKQWSNFVTFPVETPNSALGAVAREVLTAFYELFDLFELPDASYEEIGRELSNASRS